MALFQNRGKRKKKERWGSRTDMTNNAIVLFEYVCRNPDEYQTYRGLAVATGIPFGTLYYIINYDRINKVTRRVGESDDIHGLKNMLYAVAEMFGFDFLLIRQPGKIITVIKKIKSYDSVPEAFANEYIAYNDDYSGYEYFYP